LDVVFFLVVERTLWLNYEESHKTAAVGAVGLVAVLSSQQRIETRCTVRVAAKRGQFFVLKRHDANRAFFLLNISDFRLPLIFSLIDLSPPRSNETIPKLVPNSFVHNEKNEAHQNAVGNERSKQNKSPVHY